VSEPFAFPIAVAFGDDRVGQVGAKGGVHGILLGGM
jgi:hypothetical protein